MEHIGQAVTSIIKRDQALQSRQPGALLRKQNSASLPEIIQIILNLELGKQSKPLSEDQRSWLAERLYDLDETAQEIQRRAESVLLLETYGTIAYQYWVQDEIAYRDRSITKGKDIPMCPKCSAHHKEWQDCSRDQPAQPNKVAELLKQTREKMATDANEKYRCRNCGKIHSHNMNCGGV